MQEVLNSDKQIKLYINKVMNIKGIFPSAFYTKGFNLDVKKDDLSDNLPKFRVFFSNNINELEKVLSGSKELNIPPYYIDFVTDTFNSANYYIPKSNKYCPVFEYCFLTTRLAVNASYVDFDYQLKIKYIGVYFPIVEIFNCR